MVVGAYVVGASVVVVGLAVVGDAACVVFGCAAVVAVALSLPLLPHAEMMTASAMAAVIGFFIAEALRRLGVSRVPFRGARLPILFAENGGPHSL